MAAAGQKAEEPGYQVLGARAPFAFRMLTMQMAEAPEDGSNGATRAAGKVIGDQVEWVRTSASPGMKLKASLSRLGLGGGSGGQVHLATARCGSSATYRVRIGA